MNMNEKNDRQESPSNNPSETTEPAPSTPATKKVRGFARMAPERQRQVARMGGLTAHLSGHAHQFTSEEASAAGQKGGQRVSQNRQHMVTIGRMGGLQRWRNQGRLGTSATARE